MIATIRNWRGWTGAAVALLLAAHFTIAVGSKRNHSTTSDEIVHLTGGYAYWALRDYRIQPENGNLPQRWAALPAFLAGAAFPSLDTRPWRESHGWILGHQFFYGTGEDHFPRLMAARAMIALFSVGTGLLVFAWSRHLFGLTGAWLSLVLFAFCPTFLAHGALATSDACMTFFFLASVTAAWRHLQEPGWRTGLLSAVVFGLACVAKFSAVLLLPILTLLGVLRVADREPLRIGGRAVGGWRGKLAVVVGSAGAHVLVAAGVIWAFYGFRYSAFNPDLPAASHFIRRWDDVMQSIGPHALVVEWLARLRLLPEAFLYGYSYVIESAQTRGAFLNGEHSMTGWRTFFLWTFALKSTPAVLAATLLLPAAAFAWCRRDRPALVNALYRGSPLILLFAVYGTASVASHLNIGHRHLLPIYPVLFIAAGALVRLLPHRGAWLIVALLGGMQAVSAARIAPHFLAYFNACAGGPEHGYRHLVDSSLDWGQDLPGLRDWLDRHRREGEPVYLSYFGTGDPRYYGLDARPLEMINLFDLPAPFVPLEPGLYCVSATSLQHVYSPLRGPWTMAREQAYRRLRQAEPMFLDYARRPEGRAMWEATIPRDVLLGSQERYEALRFARLCEFLRARTPDAQIGYSIQVHRLDAEQLATALGHPPSE